MKNTDSLHRMIEMQKALDQMVDSIDTTKLGRLLEEQIERNGIKCYICGRMSKGLRGNSRHLKSHR